MVKVGNDSNYSDNMNNSLEHNASIISGGDDLHNNAEAETENMSSNMLNGSLEEDRIS
jgi:hypothetical protein